MFARNVDGPSSSLRMGLSRGSLFQIDSKPFYFFFFSLFSKSTESISNRSIRSISFQIKFRLTFSSPPSSRCFNTRVLSPSPLPIFIDRVFLRFLSSPLPLEMKFKRESINNPIVQL